MIALIAIIATGMLYFIVRSLDRVEMEQKRIQDTAQALAMAKQALIGFAVSVELPVEGSCNGTSCARPGELLCPDRHDPTLATSGTSSAPCGANRLGRFPWRTLDMPELRDSDGEHLWYAVAANFINSPRTLPLNSDTAGSFTIVDAAGNTVATDVVAVIIAPGAPLQREGEGSIQARSPSSIAASAYLDKSGAFDNATATPDTFVQGPVPATGTPLIVNDQIAYITRAELAAAVEKRVAREIRNCLAAYPGELPWPSPLASLTNFDGLAGSYFGRLPTTQPQTLPNTISDVTARRNALASAASTADKTAAATALASAEQTLSDILLAIQTLAIRLRDKASTTSDDAYSVTTATTVAARVARADTTINDVIASQYKIPWPAPGNSTFIPASTQVCDTSATLMPLACEVLYSSLDPYLADISASRTALTAARGSLQTDRDALELARQDYESSGAPSAESALRASATVVSTTLSASVLPHINSTTASFYPLKDLVDAMITHDAALIDPARTALATAATTAKATAEAAKPPLDILATSAAASLNADTIAAISATDTAISALDTAIARTADLLAAATSGHTNLSPLYLQTLIQSYDTAWWDSTTGFNALKNVASATRMKILGDSLKGYIETLTSGSSTVTTARTAAVTALANASTKAGEAITVLNNPAASAADRSAAINAFETAAGTAVQKASTLLDAVESTNVTWTTLVAITSDTVTWKAPLNLTKTRLTYAASHAAGDLTLLVNSATAVKTRADAIHTFASTFATQAASALTAADSARAAATTAAENPDAANIAAAIAAADAATALANIVNTTLATTNTNTNSTVTTTITWPTTCSWLKGDSQSWWNSNSWRSLVLYQRAVSSAAPDLTVNGAGSHNFVVITSGPRLGTQSRPSSRAADYLERQDNLPQIDNGDGSRDGLATNPIRQFGSQNPSGTFNDTVVSP